MRRATSTEGLAAKLASAGYDFFSGVPGSGLRQLVADLADLAGTGAIHHVPATWEAEAVALAAGAWLGGGRPCVYLQNSGLGHAVNPLTSLCLPAGIEVLLVVEHRHTLPQHRVMGEVDERLVELIGWRDVIFVDDGKSDGGGG